MFNFICLVRNFFLSSTVTTYSENNENTFSKCHKCDKSKEERTHHCSICNKCILKMDHHCIILNNCIGERNYKYFVSYLFLVTINSFTILLFSINELLYYTDEIKKVFLFLQKMEKIIYILLNFPTRIFVLTIIGIITFFSIGYFFLYHLYLILYDITELERKYKYKKFDIEIVKLSFTRKCKLTYNKLMKIIDGKNFFDLFWPD